MIGLVLFLYAWQVEPWMIRVVTYQIVSRKIPQEFYGTKIVFLSDIHHGAPRSADLRKKILRLVEAQHPDLIIFGGDYAKNTETSLCDYFDDYRELSVTLGKYGILGNHDYWDPSVVRDIMHQAGITMLDNESIRLTKGNTKIKLVGVGDLWKASPSLASLKRDVTPEDFTILLSHNPDYVDKIPQNDLESIDLVLSGHSHGGQVTLFGLYAPIQTTQRKYRTGLVKPAPGGKTTVIVSNGLGTSGLPFRFFAPPQLVVVELKGLSN